MSENQGRILAQIALERDAQDDKFGDQSDLPDGTSVSLRWHADSRRERCQRAAEQGNLTWRHIADEEWAEATAETDPLRLRAELVQLAAVCVAWIEAIDKRALTAR